MKRLILSSLVIGLVVLAVTGFAQRSPNVQYFNFPGSSGDQPFSTVVLVGDTLYMGDEKKLGSLEAGKLADLVVVDGDYMSVPEDQISELEVILTIVGGKVVYSNR